jgi:hypothetical protein
MKGAFRVKRKDIRILQKRKRKLNKRLERRQWEAQSQPMFSAKNIQYEMAERVRAINCGGIGAFHVLARNSGLIDAINRRVHLLKIHLPYHESDHVLNMAYNTLAGGTCLDDIELLRNDETYMDALGAQRIPDPTTAGDFTRRFYESDIVALMDSINSIRQKMWKKRMSRSQRAEAILDVDGTVAPTTGECKQGMGLSYNGIWGYHPLLISLANTLEPLYLVNRSGNRPSHDGAPEWIDRAVALVKGSFDRICLRGDTDFALTANFDRWTDRGVRFAFGIDAMPNLVEIAENIAEKDWNVLARRKKKTISSNKRKRPINFKEKIVVEKQYKNIKLQKEHVAEFDYKPTKCNRTYRVIVLRKKISVEKGQLRLWDDIRYFFYIANIEEKSAAEIVFFCNDRCNQENLIEQLKNGLNAMRMPVGDLVSNWAYMVMCSLAWTLKAWFALLVRNYNTREKLLRMEFRQFLNGIMKVPVQIINTSRRILFRVLGYNHWTNTFFRTFKTIRQLRLA